MYRLNDDLSELSEPPRRSEEQTDRTQPDLRQSSSMRDSWEAVLAGLDVGVVIQDRHACIRYANAKAEALLGVSFGEMVGTEPDNPRWNVISPDGRPLIGEGHPVKRALATNQPVRDVILGVLQPSSGERMWLLVSAIPELDDFGETVQVLVTFTDVSVAQNALRESSSIYQSVLRAMSEGVVVHNTDGSIRFGNAAAERTLGLTIEQLSGRSAIDPRWRLVKLDGTAAGSGDVPSEITQATGEPCQNVLLGVHRGDGQRAWVSVSTDPIREPGSDATLGVVATFTDVTTERNVKIELEASRAQMVRVIDALPGVVFQFFRSDSGQDALPFLGGRVHELLGETVEELRDDPARLLRHIHSSDLQQFLEEIDLAVRAGSTIESEIAVRRDADRHRWIRVHGIPERQGAGVLYTGVLLDVTDSHELADALQRTKRREAMADLAAGIAHNFNNMLAVILPNVEMAAASSPPEYRALLVDAAGAARSAADLVAQMLTLGRPDDRDTDGSVVDVIPVLTETLRICRSTFDRGIDIVDHVRVASAYVRGQRSQLQQVLLNLCLNARDAVLGQPDARLDVEASIDVDGFLRLELRDNGHGMSPTVKRRLGEPFFTTKHVGRGTGLGVASAFRTIRQAGGTWDVESDEGRGTTFVIRLPLTDKPVEGLTTAYVPPTVLNAGTVLIVDDEDMVRRALVRQVRALGYDAIDAANGANALEVLRERPPSDPVSLVLLDLSMPGMSGAQVLNELHDRIPSLPVVVLSGHIADSDMLAHAAAILQKPVGQAELMSAMQQALTTRAH